MDLDYVSKRLGHSSILLTSKTYIHVSTNRRRKSISIMDKELVGAQDQPHSPSAKSKKIAEEMRKEPQNP